MSEIICEFSSDFRGKYPDVPFAEGVDVEAFKADKDPFFVTLPITKIGITSRNGVPFDRAAVERIVQQVNLKKVEGILGHITPSERGSRYEMPKARWLGAMIDDEGMAWGKAYVPSYAQDVREYFRDAKRAGAKVGTSVYGMKGEKGMSDMELETIDFGHPDRLGVLEVGAIPKITAEFNNESIGEDPMSDQLIAELTSQRDINVKLVAELQKEVGAKDAQIAELAKKAEIADGLIAELGSEKPVEKVKKLLSVVAELEAAKLTSDVDGVIAELVELEDMRENIKAQLGTVASVDAARTRVAELIALPSNIKIAKSLALLVSGGRAIVGELKNADGNDYFKEPTAEQKARAQAEWGFN